MPGPVTVFSARKIVTMDASVAEATHVAVRDGISWKSATSMTAPPGDPTRSTIASPTAS